MALDPEPEDGLYFYRRISREAGGISEAGGVYFEIGYDDQTVGAPYAGNAGLMKRPE